MSEENKQEEQEKDQMQAFLDALEAKVMESNALAMREIFQAVLPPFNERLEQIATGQMTLAMALKTNRRDTNALSFARLFIEKAMAKSGQTELAQEDIHVIAANAYALASEMELHARAAELQYQSASERMDKHLQENPTADTRTLIESFYGRVPIPKVTLPKPAKTKGKH